MPGTGISTESLGRCWRGGIRLAAAFATGALALGCGVAATTAPAATALAPGTAASAAHVPSWQIVKQVRSASTGHFTAVAATGKTTGWAFGAPPVGGSSTAAPTAWLRHENAWTQVAFPAKSRETVVAVGATSPSDVWAFTDVGFGSRVMHYNGRTWSVVKTFRSQIGGATVISRHDVWVFGTPGIIAQLGAWRYNGYGWTRMARSLDGGSGLTASSVWAFSGTSVYHWTGCRWTATNLARLLPAKSMFNYPELTGIIALPANDVYAIGNGETQDLGGPIVILHYDGHDWAKVAQGNYGYGTVPAQVVSYDGHHGLWLPMPAYGGGPDTSYLLHYSAGRLTPASLPGGASGIRIDSVARIPGTAQQLAGGFTHTRNNLFGGVTAVVLLHS